MRRRDQRSFLVIGLGRFGRSLAIALTELGNEVMGVDVDMEVIEELKDLIDGVQMCDATNIRALAEVGVDAYDACIVGRGEELGESITITMNLFELGARWVIAKAATSQHARILEKLGVRPHDIVFPERDMGARLAHTLASPMISEFFQLAPNVSVMEVDSPDETHHHNLGELQLRPRLGITVLGIRRGQRFVTNPGADTVVEPGDKLVVFGEESRVEEFINP